jgi:hypothetical protein
MGGYDSDPSHDKGQPATSEGSRTAATHRQGWQRSVRMPIAVADGFEIVAHLDVIHWPQLPLELLQAFGDRIENAPVPAKAVRTNPSIGNLGRPEQPLEDDPRIILGHQRQRRRKSPDSERR